MYFEKIIGKIDIYFTLAINLICVKYFGEVINDRT